MKKRYFRLTMAVAISIASTLCIFLFLPATFEQRDFTGIRPVTYKGFPAQRVGFSRLCQSGNADGKNCGGKFYDGRCYVDYVDGTGVRRTYGKHVWICTHYEEVLSKTGKVLRFNVTNTTIDLQ